MYRISIDKERQRIMEEAFYRQLRERCQPDDNPQRALPMVVGIETEYLVVDQQGQLISEAQRNQILAALAHSTPELGMSTLETHTEPVPAFDVEWGMLQEMQRVERAAIAAAHKERCRLVRVGAYPGLFTDLDITRQPDRFATLMDICHSLHGVFENGADLIRVGNITLPQRRCNIMSGCQSIHINIQVPAGQLAIHLLNKAIEFVPYLVALGANAPLMNCEPSGFREYRIPLWDPLFSFPEVDARHGIKTRRTGLPDDYYTDWNHYWKDVADKLYFTDDVQQALESNMKQFWRIVRLKPCPGLIHDCLLELRALSTQPSVDEDAALHMLLLALLHHEDRRNRPLLPMHFVRANLDQASRYGLEATLYIADDVGQIVQRPAAEIAARLIDRASAFWQRTAPVAAEQVALLRERLEPDAASPALASLRLFERGLNEGQTPQEAAQRVFMAYVVEP